MFTNYVSITFFVIIFLHNINVLFFNIQFMLNEHKNLNNLFGINVLCEMYYIQHKFFNGVILILKIKVNLLYIYHS